MDGARSVGGLEIIDRLGAFQLRRLPPSRLSAAGTASQPVELGHDVGR